MAILDDLREAVAKAGRTHADICRECGIHPKTFSSFIHGRRGLSIGTCEQLANALRFRLKLVRVREESKSKDR